MSGQVGKIEEEIPKSKPIYIFGRDVTEIPCFRRSFIFGICSGVVGGLACFLGTSKTLFSTHIAFASLWIGVFGYWFPCRYKIEIQQMAMEAHKLKNRKDASEENAEKETEKNL